MMMTNFYIIRGAKTLKILPNPSFWTFFTFLIILMLGKNPGNVFWVLPESQRLKKVLIYGSAMIKSPLRYTKSPKTQVIGHYCPPWSTWWNTSWVLLSFQEIKKESYMRLQQQNPYQDTKKHSKPFFWDILTLPIILKI